MKRKFTRIAGLGRMSIARVCAAALSLLSAGARADDPNPYSLGILETVTHDNNVFRAPDGDPISTDWISTTGLVGSLNQTIGRERLIASGEFDLDRFKRNTQLNSTAHSVSLEGDWATVGDLSGEVGYSNSSQLYRYSLDTTQTFTAKNTLDTAAEFARIHLGVVTRWTLDAIFNGSRRTYSADAYKYRNLSRHDVSLGTSYLATPDLRTSLSFRRTHGQFPNYLSTGPDNFTRDDVIFGMNYDASGASVFSLNLSKAREQHSAIETRSSRTWNADGKWAWTPTGRTQLTLGFSRDDDTGETNTVVIGDEADARRQTSLNALVTYELTSKIRLNASGVFSRRELDAAFTAIPGASARGRDHLYQVGLGLTYSPNRAIQLGCNGAREKRAVEGDTLSITYPYSDTTYGCTAQFAFN